MSVHRPGDQVDTAQTRRRRVVHLRHVTDRGVAPGRRASEHFDRARARPHEAEDGAHQRRLAGPVRTEDADELALGDGDRDVGQHVTPAHRERDAAQRDGVQRLSAASSASSWASIQCW